MNDEDPQSREWTPEERAKAERAQWILYAVMVVFIVAPFMVLWLKKS